jgi:hypothetical protein
MSFLAPISQLPFNDYVKLMSCIGVPASVAFLYVHRRSSARTWPLGRLAQIVRGAVVDLVFVKALPTQPLLVHTGPGCAPVVHDPLPEK